MQYNTSPLTDYMFYKAGKLGVPLSGTFELTPLCNFKCRMCYVRKTNKELEECARSIRTIEQWIALASEARDAGMLHLLLTGGEPTLYPDFWDLYEKLSYMGLILSINTNGSTIDENAISILTKRPPRRINITLYGASDYSYEKLCGVKNMFSKVDAAICRLQKEGIQVKLNCSLTPWNVNDLEAMVHYAQEKGLILDIASYMFPPMRRNSNMIGINARFEPEQAAFYRLKAFRLQYGENKYKEYICKIKNGSALPLGLEEGCVDPLNGQFHCRAGKSSFWATWDGWMMPCGMMIEPQIDMYGRTFLESWNKLKLVCANIKLNGICEACENQQICHSCAAMSLTETGQFTGIPTYLCRMVNEMKKIASRELVEINEENSKGGRGNEEV